MNVLPSILLVDDERSIRAALRRELQRDGYQIFEAGSANEALLLMKIHRIDVLLTDQRMPSMSGAELLEVVSQNYPNTVRLLLSGYTDFSALVTSINSGGISAFIHKPWHPEELREMIFHALRKAAEYRRLKQVPNISPQLPPNYSASLLHGPVC